MGGSFSGGFLLVQQALTLFVSCWGSWMGAAGKSAKQKGAGLHLEVLCDPGESRAC